MRISEKLQKLKPIQVRLINKGGARMKHLTFGTLVAFSFLLIFALSVIELGVVSYAFKVFDSRELLTVFGVACINYALVCSLTRND